MLDFLINNKEYEIKANNQLSVILSQFDATYIMNVIEDTLGRQLNSFNLMGPPNAVESFELMFKELYETYPEDHTNIDDSRIEVYREIIDSICRHMQLSFQETERLDLYTMAYYLYDFYVAHLNNYLVTFYDRYIQSEKDNLCANYRLEGLERKRDMGASYVHYAFGDDETMALVVANLPLVLSNLRQMPIPDEYVYRTIYGPQNESIVQLFIQNVVPRGSVFGLFNTLLFNEQLYPTIVTHIRMAIQQSCRAELNAAASIAAGGKA